MAKQKKTHLEVRCSHCGFANVFNQPYAYHAGFSDQGFLYNESGTCTLVWNSYDPDYKAIVGVKHPWILTTSERQKLEDSLDAAPDGSRWLFKNPARCLKCAYPISGPITETIYYLQYDGSVDTDAPDAGLKIALKKKTDNAM